MILTVDVPEITISCSTPAFDIEFTTEPPDGAPLAPIPFDADADYAMSLASEPFEVPPVVLSSTCDIAFRDLINDFAGLPVDGTATLALVRGTPVPPTTPTTQAPTTTARPGGDGAGTGAGTGSAARPRFTG